MTREQLLDAVGDIRDAFIREAAPPPASYRKQREFPWTGAVAACLALMIVGSTFFLSQMNMGDGATGSGGASAVTEDTAEVGESGGTVNGAADGTDDSEPETAAITVTVDGTVYVQAGGVGRHPEACPEGFSYAGEAELPDTGELCPYYADPERPGQIYVYQSRTGFFRTCSAELLAPAWSGAGWNANSVDRGCEYAVRGGSQAARDWGADWRCHHIRDDPVLSGDTLPPGEEPEHGADVRCQAAGLLSLPAV